MYIVFITFSMYYLLSFLYFILCKATEVSVACNELALVSVCRCRTISASSQVQGGDFNLYEGQRCHGVPLVTISRGRLVCENGAFTCAQGSGRFYPMRSFPDFLYKKMVQREKVLLSVYESLSLCHESMLRVTHYK